MQIALNDVLDEVSGVRGDSLPVDLTPPVKAFDGIGSTGDFLLLPAGDVFVHRPLCTDRVIELRVGLADKLVSVRVPHGLISDVWTTGDLRVGLCLKVAIVVRGETELGLEPLTALA